ncbi:MAG: hypothetical protein PHG48_08280 [Eubacteriales bacterium]|nr:hypothetical protein [Eubacteriales bacterium]
MSRSKTLLFYFSDESVSASSAIVPTLARLAEENSTDFETYICTRPVSPMGRVLPFTGHNHGESFYYLSNFYDKIAYCSISSYDTFQFKREVMAFGGDIVSIRKADEVLEFYADIFAYFGRKMPDSVIVVPDKPADENDFWIAPYCYPDIMFSDSLGISQDTIINCGNKLIETGIKKVFSLYCHVQPGQFHVGIVDSVRENDCFATVTERIAKRHIEKAKGIGFSNASCLYRWQASYCRDKIITLYQDYDWESFLPTVHKYAEMTGNYNIMGNQIVYSKESKKHMPQDSIITEFARKGLVMNLIGVNPRIAFSIQRKHKLPLDWLADSKAPWEDEYSDKFLTEKIESGAIPVCFIFYAADLGHLPVITRFLDLMSIEGMKAGIAFPSTWYEYHPELLEQIYIPLSQGGVFPQLEPLISSVGVAVAPEAEGFFAPELLTSNLLMAKEEIAGHIGEKMVPKGYFPFQDSNPYYKRNTGTPQYEAVSKAGFEYCVSHKDEGTNAKILCETNGMLVMNQQIEIWFYGSKNPLGKLMEWEKIYTASEWDMTGKESPYEPKWITFSFDTPFFALSPVYMRSAESGINAANPNYGSMHYIYEAMQYVLKKGGDSGKLFLLKPHELYRYAKLIDLKKMQKKQGEFK